jgi:hypothetical protein
MGALLAGEQQSFLQRPERAVEAAVVATATGAVEQQQTLDLTHRMRAEVQSGTAAAAAAVVPHLMGAAATRTATTRPL